MTQVFDQNDLPKKNRPPRHRHRDTEAGREDVRGLPAARAGVLLCWQGCERKVPARPVGPNQYPHGRSAEKRRAAAPTVQRRAGKTGNGQEKVRIPARVRHPPSTGWPRLAPMTTSAALRWCTPRPSAPCRCGPPPGRATPWAQTRPAASRPARATALRGRRAAGAWHPASAQTGTAHRCQASQALSCAASGGPMTRCVRPWRSSSTT